MDTTWSNDRPFRSAVFPVPGFALVSYACTVEPLRAANLFGKTLLYEVINFDNGAPTPSSGSAQVEGAQRIGEVPALDLFLVVAGGDPFDVFFRDQQKSRIAPHKGHSLGRKSSSRKNTPFSLG